MRIALVVTMAFAAIWMVALRPKPVEEPPLPTPPAQVQKADPVAKAPAPTPAKTETATPAKVEKADPAPAKPAAEKAEPAAAKAAKPAEKPAKPAGATPLERRVNAVLADLDARKVVVLLFWDRNGTDDQEVRRAVSRVDRRAGTVAVHTAALSDLAGYEPITAGVPIVGTPTVLVIDRNRKALAISGLTVTREIDQKVTKAFKASR